MLGLLYQVVWAYQEFERGRVPRVVVDRAKEAWKQQRKKTSSITECFHCGHEACYFMVTKKVWNQAREAAGMTRTLAYEKGLMGEYLCLWCVEKLIGRDLNLDDFPKLRINREIRWALKK